MDERAATIEHLTEEKAAELFDRQARRYCGMSGEEFVRRFDAGELRCTDHGVARVAILLPLVRPTPLP